MSSSHKDKTDQEIQSTVVYDDANHRVEKTSDLNTLNDNLIKSVSFYDGLGRTTESRSYEADGDYRATQTQYDALNRPFKQSNLFRPTEVDGSHPILWTTTRYDSLSRAYEIETPDGAIVKTAFDGNRVLVTDQAGKQRISKINAMGQIKEVWEVTSPDSATESISFPNQSLSAGYKTTYGYDVLNNLLTVNQGSQTRSFAYNSLSRLTSAANPESGTVSNTYDANGNILTQRDARGIKTIFDYDALNRVTHKCFRVIGSGNLGATSCAQAGGEQTEANTSDVIYAYDASTISFSKAQLTKIQNGSSTTEFLGFDADGNILSQKQNVDEQDYTTSYTYSLSGSLLEETYPSGRVVKNTYENDGNLSQVLSKRDAAHGFFNYAHNFTYAPSGRITSMRLGNNSWESVQLNSRLQPTQIAVGTTPNAVNLWKINYEFGELQSNGTVDVSKNNSNIAKQTITVPTIGSVTGFTAEQTFTYDSLKRLKTGIEKTGGNQIWKQTFNYDQFGNRTFEAANTTTIPSGCSAAICNPSIDTANNRIGSGQGYTFDAGGNLTHDADNKKFVYDARNKITEVRNASTNAILTKNFYDGDGVRVKIEENGVTTVFVYDAFDKIIAEYTVNASANPAPKVSYMTNDLLGTPRLITDENRQVLSRRDMTPFGEEIAVGTGGRTLGQQYSVVDDVRSKFTGQQRDEIAKLDYFNARHYRYSIGRFMSADNFGGKLSNPQSLNLYAYTLNNPLKWVDPTGHSPDDPSDCIKDGIEQCHNGGNNEAVKPNGDTYWLNKEVVNVSGGDGSSFTVETKTAAGSELAGSWQDFTPVWGPLRGMTFNMNCRTGGCNFGRAAGNFVLLAADLSTLGAAAWGRSVAKVGVTEAGEMFAREVAEESGAIGAGIIRNNADAVLYHYTDEVSATAIQNSQLGMPGANLFLTPKGHLSPLQAQIELALPRGNTAQAVFSVNAKTLNGSNLVRSGRVTGNVFNRAGGGTEVVFRQTIPPSGFTRIK